MGNVTINEAVSNDGDTVIKAYYDMQDRACIRIQICGETFKLTRYLSTTDCLNVFEKLATTLED